MVVIMYSIKIITIFIFIICLITLVESQSQFDCPSISSSDEDLQTFMIQLSSQDAKEQHYAMLESCYNKRVGDSTIQSNNPNDHGFIKDVSLESFTCYIGQFGPSHAAALASLPEVIHVEPDSEGSSAAPLHIQILETDAPSNLDRIDQPSRPLDGSYTYPASSGNGVNVYIVDSGINIDNVEFEGRATRGPVFCSGCPNIDDLGMSLQSDLSQAVNNAIRQLTTLGIHVIVAAGNFAKDACTITPASAPDAITVAATDTDTDTIADFSDFGTCVNIFAPGTNIAAAGNKNSSALSIYTGTSQATPHVAGTVALIIASGGNRSPAQMKIDLDNLSTKNIVLGNINGSPNRFLRVPYCAAF
ncbi:2213_t:CDS:2 [Cetraspora pellucida]|uniref:2213_t:CDS:1 n=1 Tax=Cetraspora pellucida TaxID=1433469 RepID=A0A9N9DF22_9GLOM|nr:2213_t:CDS:2 [Cetraspora pellucida]